MTGTAEFLREFAGMQGAAAVYKLTPPYSTPQGAVRYVVASAVDLPDIGIPGYRTSETMVFPFKDSSLASLDLMELVMIPYRSHVDALAELGYAID